MNPISKLQELMQSQGKAFPVYMFTNCPPEGILPVFQCDVTASGHSASARAKNKKDAKRVAAEELLRVIEAAIPKIILPVVSLPDIELASLTRRIPDVNSPSLTRKNIFDVNPALLTRKTIPDDQPGSLVRRTSSPTEIIMPQDNNVTHRTTDAEDIVSGNFVGRLQTFCQQNEINSAKHDVVQCVNVLPVCYQATCKLGNLSRTCIGSSKQIAKQAAAQDLISQLEWSDFERYKLQTSSPIIVKYIPDSALIKEPTERTSRITQFRSESNSSSSSIDLSTADAIQSRDESLDSVTSSNNSIGAVGRMKKLQIDQSDSLSCPLNNGEDSGVSITSEKTMSKSCYLCANSFHEDGRMVTSDLSGSDVKKQLLQKKLPISEALHIFHYCDDQFFDSIDNWVDFLDLVLSELNCIYSLSFTKTKHKNESVCTLDVNDLKGARFLGIAATAQVAFKNAVVNGLRSLSTMMKKHQYHELHANVNGTEM